MNEAAVVGQKPADASPGAPANTVPTISGNPDLHVAVGNTYVFQPVASDSDGDLLSFSVTGLPGWAIFDAQRGSISGVPALADTGVTADITLSVSDGRAVALLAPFHISVTAASLLPPLPASGNLAPTISGVPARQVQAETPYAFVPQGFDPDSSNLTYSVQNKPSWAGFSTHTGELSGTPAAAQAGSYANIVISISDGSLSASLPAFDIDVTPAPNRAPTLSGVPAATVSVGSTYHFMPVAADPEGDTLTFSSANLPTWAALSPSTGEVTGVPLAAQVGVYDSIVLRASDGTHMVALPPFKITVIAAPNSAPTIAGSPSTGVTAGSSYHFQPSGFDADGQALTYAVTSLPRWARFDPATGTLTGTPSGTDLGTYGDITISVSDGNSSAALAAFGITVSPIPNAAPTISGAPP
ncbi:MAG: putative Ig domain-containing protein, partial [Steroidobacteraceae bacterium]